MGIQREQAAVPVAMVDNMAEQLAKGMACIVAVGDMLNEAESATEAS